jgi:hypothetical protein
MGEWNCSIRASYDEEAESEEHFIAGNSGMKTLKTRHVVGISDSYGTRILPSSSDWEARHVSCLNKRDEKSA